MAKNHPFFVTFFTHRMLWLSKNDSSGQFSTYFRLKTKSQDEFLIKEHVYNIKPIYYRFVKRKKNGFS